MSVSGRATWRVLAVLLALVLWTDPFEEWTSVIGPPAPALVSSFKWIFSAWALWSLRRSVRVLPQRSRDAATD